MLIIENFIKIHFLQPPPCFFPTQFQHVNYPMNVGYLNAFPLFTLHNSPPQTKTRPLVRLTIISEPQEAPQRPVIRKFPMGSTNGTAPSSSDTTRPSTVANETQWSIDDETEIPKKWVDAYKILLEWNEELKAELERAKEKLALLS